MEMHKKTVSLKGESQFYISLSWSLPFLEEFNGIFQPSGKGIGWFPVKYTESFVIIKRGAVNVSCPFRSVVDDRFISSCETYHFMSQFVQ